MTKLPVYSLSQWWVLGITMCLLAASGIGVILEHRATGAEERYLTEMDGISERKHELAPAQMLATYPTQEEVRIAKKTEQETAQLQSREDTLLRMISQPSADALRYGIMAQFFLLAGLAGNFLFIALSRQQSLADRPLAHS